MKAAPVACYQHYPLIHEILKCFSELVGQEMLVVKIESVVLVLGLLAIIMMLLSRLISVAIPVSLLKRKSKV